MHEVSGARYYVDTVAAGWYLTFSKIRKSEMKRLKQYIKRPTPTKQMRATWSSHSVSPTPPSKPLTPLGRLGRGSWLYQEMLEGDAQGIKEVKKPSNESASAEDHAQIKTTSNRV